MTPSSTSNNLVGSRLCLAIVGPEVPGAKVHQRLGEERTHVGVVRVCLVDHAHRIGISAVEWCAVSRRRIGITLRDSLDERSLDRLCIGRKITRLGQGFRSLASVRRVNRRIVDVWTAGIRDPPPRHRTFGIDRRRLPEGADGFIMVETVEEFQPLVEKALGFGRGSSYRTAPRTQPLKNDIARLRGAQPDSRPPLLDRPIVRRTPDSPLR